jgi:hypothetical protein
VVYDKEEYVALAVKELADFFFNNLSGAKLARNHIELLFLTLFVVDILELFVVRAYAENILCVVDEGSPPPVGVPL